MKQINKYTIFSAAILVPMSLLILNPQALGALQWPRQTQGIAVQKLVANDVDNLSLMNCDESSTPNQFTHIADGYQTSTIGQYSDSHVMCGVRDASGQVEKDGTLYTRYVATVDGQLKDHIAAIKNGRVVWSTNIMSDPHCSVAGGQQYASPYSTSVGADGNVYTIIQSQYAGCAKYVAGFNSKTGEQLFKHYQTDTYGTDRWRERNLHRY